MIVHLFSIKRTGVGARQLVIPIDPSIKVREYWGKGTHGEAKVEGHGKFLYVDVSSLGNHRCILYELRSDGKLVALESARRTKYCTLCERYRR